MLVWCIFVFFFFKQKTAYEMRISDWSSDVCSSDVLYVPAGRAAIAGMSRGVSNLLGYAQAGTEFICCPLARPEIGGASFAIAALPVINFFASMVSFLCHLGIQQQVVRLEIGSVVCRERLWQSGHDPVVAGQL